jgi:hypothetical protein
VVLLSPSTQISQQYLKNGPDRFQSHPRNLFDAISLSHETPLNRFEKTQRNTEGQVHGAWIVVKPNIKGSNERQNEK